jgi:DNA-binding transcriptional regulator YdaS (Cro superfamily)
MSKFSEWVRAERGRQSALARHLNLKAPTVSEWVIGERPVPVRYALDIEAFTGGAVTRCDLLPTTWRRIWPELGTGQPVTESPAQGVANV